MLVSYCLAKIYNFFAFAQASLTVKTQILEHFLSVRFPARFIKNNNEQVHPFYTRVTSWLNLSVCIFRASTSIFVFYREITLLCIHYFYKNIGGNIQKHMT